MYRTLDPVTEGPGVAGPSRDWHAIAAAEPVYRQEPHSMRGKRMPVQIAPGAVRPITHASPVVGMQLGRVPIMIRSSNQRPIEAGVSADGSVWSVSDPGFIHRHDSLAADAVPADGSSPAPTYGWDANLKARLVMIGIAAGLVVYLARKNKSRG